MTAPMPDVLKSAHFCGMHGEASRMGGRKKVSVLLPAELFRRFDVFCETQGYKKSPLIARLIREHIEVYGASEGERQGRSGKTSR